MGLSGRLFSEPEISTDPRFGPLLLLMMVNRATIQIHFTEAPVSPAEQRGTLVDYRLGVGE